MECRAAPLCSVAALVRQDLEAGRLRGGTVARRYVADGTLPQFYMRPLRCSFELLRAFTNSVKSPFWSSTGLTHSAGRTHMTAKTKTTMECAAMFCAMNALLFAVSLSCLMIAAPSASVAQQVLPFPPKPSGSTAGLTMQESVYSPQPAERRLREGAPNILVVLIDDAGLGLPTTFGGEVNTPTLERISKAGVSYNRFHTTAMCSPTRAALLTGRNHHRVGNGQITE